MPNSHRLSHNYQYEDFICFQILCERQFHGLDTMSQIFENKNGIWTFCISWNFHLLEKTCKFFIKTSNEWKQYDDFTCFQILCERQFHYFCTQWVKSLRIKIEYEHFAFHEIFISWKKTCRSSRFIWQKIEWDTIHLWKLRNRREWINHFFISKTNWWISKRFMILSIYQTFHFIICQTKC